jgi:glycosyltransferase involved in cell wall biosynthesis
MNHSWDYGWTMYQMLAEALSRESEVVYIDAPKSVARFGRADVGLLGRAVPERVNESLHVLRSATFPAHRTEGMRWWAAALAARKTRRWARRADFDPDLVWCYMPYDLEFVERFPHAVSTYWVADHERLLPGEERLMERVDAILCGAVPVLERFESRYGPRAQYFPVACDFERYHGAAPGYAGLANVERPIYGYAGFVGDRLDFDLIEELASSLTEGTVVIAGPLRGLPATTIERLEATGRVTFLGPLDRDDVPRAIADFDVALIPYTDTEFNRNCNPVKFYEYLALAKPIVTTDIPTLHAVGSAVASVGPRDTYVGRAIDALASSPGTGEERVALAREHSFEAAVARLDAILAPALAGAA